MVLRGISLIHLFEFPIHEARKRQSFELLNNLESMDDPCLIIALQLQLEDLEEFRRSRKGKGVEGDVNDEDLALDAYRAEVEAMYNLLHDSRVAQSIARAVETDAEVISIAREDEARATRDRQLACTLGGVAPPPNLQSEDVVMLDADDDALKRFAYFNTATSIGEEDKKDPCTTPSSSKLNGKIPEDCHEDVKRQECVVCGEQKHDFDTLRAPCGDLYCRDCVVSLFRAAIEDESLFPPRCCRQPIGIELAMDFLGPTIQAEFRAKSTEFSSSNRTYCFQPSCSRFLPPSTINNDVGTCPCGSRTCTICKAEAHNGECPDDPATRDLLALATTNGWRQCLRCKRMIELTYGCNHITQGSPAPRVFHALTPI